MLSKRYATATEELWNPQVAGATRPGSGSPWDYQTAVYNPHLVREGVKGQGGLGRRNGSYCGEVERGKEGGKVKWGMISGTDAAGAG